MDTETDTPDVEAERPTDPRWVTMGLGSTARSRWGASAPSTETPKPAPVPAYDWLSDGEAAPVDTPLTTIDDAPSAAASAGKIRAGWGGSRRAAEPAKRSAFSRPGDRLRRG